MADAGRVSLFFELPEYTFSDSFRVGKPQLIQSHVVYECYGQLSARKGGEFSIVRRYSDFYALKQALSLAWPGFYVPPIPAKQTFGNTEKEFILERKEELDKFIQ